MGRRWEDLTPAEQDREWKYWQEKRENSFGARFVNEVGRAVDDTIDPFHLLHPEDKEKKESKHRDHDYDDWHIRDDDSIGKNISGGDPPDWLMGLLALALLTLPYSLYFIVGLFGVIAIAFGLGVWSLYYLAEQLAHFLLGL